MWQAGERTDGVDRRGHPRRVDRESGNDSPGARSRWQSMVVRGSGMAMYQVVPAPRTESARRLPPTSSTPVRTESSPKPRPDTSLAALRVVNPGLHTMSSQRWVRSTTLGSMMPSLDRAGTDLGELDAAAVVGDRQGEAVAACSTRRRGRCRAATCRARRARRASRCRGRSHCEQGAARRCRPWRGSHAVASMVSISNDSCTLLAELAGERDRAVVVLRELGPDRRARAACRRALRSGAATEPRRRPRRWRRATAYSM